MEISIRPLPDAYLQKVRETGLDDLDQPVRRSTALGWEPCRDVLRRARPGEEIILASFCPFDEPGPFREFGPVYVLAAASSETVAWNRFPASSGVATDYFGSSLVVRAYNQILDVCAATLTTPEAAPGAIAALLARPGVEFVDARFPTYGCFACRFTRVTST